MTQSSGCDGLLRHSIPAFTHFSWNQRPVPVQLGDTAPRHAQSPHEGRALRCGYGFRPRTRRVNPGKGPTGGRGIHCRCRPRCPGHLLGGVETLGAIVTLQALRTGSLPGTVNLENPVQGSISPSPAPPVGCAGSAAAITNAFGFGGHSTALVITAAYVTSPRPSNQQRTIRPIHDATGAQRVADDGS
jgi:hypothetical protein